MRDFLSKGKVLEWCAIMAMAGLILLFGFSDSCARMKDMSSASDGQSVYRSAKVSQVCMANKQQRVHRVNRAGFCVTNYGFFGSQTRDVYESSGGCFNPDPESETKPAESFEYPIGSNLEYHFQGGLWIGAIVPGEGKLDTLVSLACDGWQWIYELFPDGPDPLGAIVERTIRPTIPNMQYVDICTTSEAISEQDILVAFDDLLTPVTACSDWDIDPFDNRHHVPIGVRVTQKSYAWSYSYAEDFFLMDFWIKNVNPNEDTIKDVYIGIYMDGDVGHTSEPLGGSQDDITGFLDTLPNPINPSQIDTIATAWLADNDGFLGSEGSNPPGAFHDRSCTGVTGVRVVKSPPAPENDTLQLYGEFFNWFVSNTSGGDKDWGPWKLENALKYKAAAPYGRDATNFPDNVLGTPGGDISKYFMMSNREWDYDQVYSKQDFTDEGWLPPSASEGDALAQGYDTRYVFSFGPIYEIAPGDSVPLTIGYIAGENFHTRPYNRRDNLPNNPDEFKANLSFSDFAINSQWAARVYDNPGVDTDGDGYAGEPIIDPVTGDTLGYRTGDGVPDFAGPPPPPSPDLSFTVTQGQVTFSWNGRETEQGKDAFTGKQDFEGYRIYMGEVKLGAEYSLIHSADRIDFKLWRFNPLLASPKFEHKFPSVPAESLKSWFWDGATPEEVFDSIKAHPDSINAWTYSGLSKTLMIGKGSDEKLEIGDGDLFYFRQQDWNRGFAEIIADTAFRNSVDRNQPTDTLDKYWDYEYTVSGLLPSRQVRFAVTAFDYGNPSTALEPLESSKSVNEFKVYPLSSPQEVKSGGKKIVVYPNPYRGDGGYAELGFEDPDGSGWRRESDRRLWFVNLPERCTIRIYTLDGDLVREIEHDGRGSSNPTMDYWNLISRNTQAVVSGIYLFSVEDKDTGEIQIGKFVIIM